MPAISKTRDYAMPSVGFCEKSNGKCCLLGGGPAERDSQSLPQLLVEHKINRKASSSWRHFSSMFWKMSPGIWVACCRAVPTGAQELSPMFQTGDTWDGQSIWVFSYVQRYCSLHVCKTCLPCWICMEVNSEDPEQFFWVSFVRVLICIL